MRSASRAVGGGAGDDAGEHRVVPVHRPAVLRLERVGHVRDDVGEVCGGELPVGPFLADGLGDRHRAPQAVADRGRAGEQRVRPRRAVDVAGPDDLAAAVCSREHEVDGPLDDRPHRVEEAAVAREQVVVPHAGRDVGADVGVELEVLDSVGEVVVVPRAVLELDGETSQSYARSASERRPPTVERHRRLDVVPRIGVPAGIPEDRPLGICSAAIASTVALSSAALKTPATSGRRVTGSPACGRTPRGSSRAPGSGRGQRTRVAVGLLVMSHSRSLR